MERGLRLGIGSAADGDRVSLEAGFEDHVGIRFELETGNQKAEPSSVPTSF